MIETTILSNLIENETYTRKILPFINKNYFDEPTQRFLFLEIDEYFNKYNALPTKEALKISIESKDNLNEKTYYEAVELIDSLKIDKNTSIDWLYDQTEKFCKDKALFNAIKQSILIMDEKDKSLSKGNIPQLLSDALAVSFDSSIGHDFLEDVGSRHEFYHRKEERIEFDIDLLNKVTKGGLPRKSLTLFLGTSGGGKSLVMCHCAATNLMHGKNVLYITLEMAEERIAERIDANLLDITIDELKMLPRPLFEKRIETLKKKTASKLIIKEYPTGSAGSAHFRHLLNELRIKKNFVPDVVYIDYLSICASARIKNAGAANSYTLVKTIAEELRGLAIEFNIPTISALQANRSGYNNSDVDETNVAESMGILYTTDAMFALIATEDLDKLGQIMIKQIKNRWNDLNFHKRFVVGIDRSKMKLYNVDDTQQNLTDDKPVMSNTGFGNRQEEDDTDSKFKKKTKKWEGGNFY